MKILFEMAVNGHDHPCTAMLIDLVLNERGDSDADPPPDVWYEERDNGFPPESEKREEWYAIGEDGELTLRTVGFVGIDAPLAELAKDEGEFTRLLNSVPLLFELEVTGPLTELGAEEVRRRLKESKEFRDCITFPEPVSA